MTELLKGALALLGVVNANEKVVKYVEARLVLIVDPVRREAETGLVISQLRAGQIPTIVSDIFDGVSL